MGEQLHDELRELGSTYRRASNQSSVYKRSQDSATTHQPFGTRDAKKTSTKSRSSIGLRYHKIRCPKVNVMAFPKGSPACLWLCNYKTVLELRPLSDRFPILQIALDLQ